MNGCRFCNLQEMGNRIIIQNDFVVAFPTNMPIVPGHVLVCPVRHCERIEELTSQELVALLELRVQIRKALKEVFAAEGFHYAWNEGRVGGQSVPHLHLHMVPRKEGDTGITEYEPRKFLYRPGSREEKPAEELEAVAKEIAMRLSESS